MSVLNSVKIRIVCFAKCIITNYNCAMQWIMSQQHANMFTCVCHLESSFKYRQTCWLTRKTRVRRSRCFPRSPAPHWWWWFRENCFTNRMLKIDIVVHRSRSYLRQVTRRMGRALVQPLSVYLVALALVVWQIKRLFIYFCIAESIQYPKRIPVSDSDCVLQQQCQRRNQCEIIVNNVKKSLQYSWIGSTFRGYDLILSQVRHDCRNLYHNSSLLFTPSSRALFYNWGTIVSLS